MDISKYFAGTKLESRSSSPLYMQITEVIASKILDYTLAAGTKLPPERELAMLFRVSRTTAINAYRKLEQQGLVRTKVGSGTYVASTTEQDSSPGIPWTQLLFTPYPQTSVSSILRELVSSTTSVGNISLAAGLPDPAYYPIDTFKNLFNKHIDYIDRADLGYIATEGYTPLRCSVASMLNGKNITTTMENILILSGSQQGLYLISKVLLEPGDYVIVESPTFIGAIQVFQAAGARLLCLPTSDSFPMAILEDYLIRYRPKMLYIIPTFQNPTGRVLPEHERRELLQLAARHRLVIVEDDPYSDFYYGEQPPAALKTLDTYGGVIYMSTFSKVLFPGLRVGFIEAHPALVNRLALEKQYIDLHSNNLSQWLIHLFLEAGSLAEHLSLVRKEYKKRRNVLSKAIRRSFRDDLVFTLPEGGFYLWCKIQNSITSSKFLHEAAKNGVSFVPSEAFYTTPTGGQELRLCFAAHNETDLMEGVRRLAKSFVQATKRKDRDISYNTTIKPII